MRNLLLIFLFQVWLSLWFETATSFHFETKLILTLTQLTIQNTKKLVTFWTAAMFAVVVTALPSVSESQVFWQQCELFPRHRNPSGSSLRSVSHCAILVARNRGITLAQHLSNQQWPCASLSAHTFHYGDLKKSCVPHTFTQTNIHLTLSLFPFRGHILHCS